MINKGYKIRLYPTQEQKEKIHTHFDACRFIWNYMLNLQTNLYKSDKDFMSGYDMTAKITELRNSNKYSWLRNVSAASLSRECLKLGNSIKSFLKHESYYPKFKTAKYFYKSYPVNSNSISFNSGTVSIEKIGLIKYKTDIDINEIHKVKGAHISQCENKYFLSLNCDYETEDIKPNVQRMGIDLGVKEFAVVAFEDKKYVYHNINKSKQIKNLKQRILFMENSINNKYNIAKENTGKYTKSNNIKKIENKIDKLYNRIENIKTNYIHQITSELVKMKPGYIVIETLKLRRMTKNKNLKKYILEENFDEFIFTLKYKCKENGIEFIQADKYFPSSKMCSSCGYINDKLSLSDRIYKCPNCKLSIDRDYNAALNLMKYATPF